MLKEQSTQFRSRSQKFRRRSVFGLFALGVMLIFFIGSLFASERHLFSKTVIAVNTNPPAAIPLAPPQAQNTTTPERPSVVREEPAATSSVSTTSPPLPSPGAAQPAPAAHTFGISVADTLVELGDAELKSTLDDIVSLGVTWLRVDVDWSVVQRRNNTAYDWSKTDRVIAAAKERHLNVLAILIFTPAWARRDACNTSNRCPPARAEDFAEFARAAAKRYTPQGVHSWEIWNEPNIEKFWVPSPDPAAYSLLLTSSYGAIKKVDPSATVLAGGLSPAATRDGRIAPVEFLSGMYAAGAKNSFDAVGFHPYSFPLTPNDTGASNAWQQMASTKQSLRSVMEKNDDASKKIWLTEYGAPTNGPGKASDSFNPFQKTDHVSEALQTEMLDEAFRAVEGYSWVGPLFWYSYKDLGTSDDTVENVYGLLRFDGTQKPAYETLRTLLLGN